MTIEFDLDVATRAELLHDVFSRLEAYYTDTKSAAVTLNSNPAEVRKIVTGSILNGGVDASKALDHVMSGLETHAVHTPHPKYFGLFNPRANFPSILADLITAAYNPQMAAWSHAPFAAEVEAYLIREFWPQVWLWIGTDSWHIHVWWNRGQHHSAALRVESSLSPFCDGGTLWCREAASYLLFQ